MLRQESVAGLHRGVQYQKNKTFRQEECRSLKHGEKKDRKTSPWVDLESRAKDHKEYFENGRYYWEAWWREEGKRLFQGAGLSMDSGND